MPRNFLFIHENRHGQNAWTECHEGKEKLRRERRVNCLNNEMRLSFGGRIRGFWFTWMDVNVSQARKEQKQLNRSSDQTTGWTVEESSSIPDWSKDFLSHPANRLCNPPVLEIFGAPFPVSSDGSLNLFT